MSKKYKILVCRGPECGDRLNSSLIHMAMVDGIRKRGLEGHCELGWQSCFGRCRMGPNVLIRAITPADSRFLFAVAPILGGPGAALYNGVTPGDVGRLLDEHVTKGLIVRDLIRRPGEPENKDGK